MNTNTMYKALGLPSLVIITLFLFVASCRNQDPIQITDAWIRAMPPSQTMTAGFLRIENTSPQDNALVAVETAMADTVEMHEMVYENEMMKMQPVPRIAIPAGQTAQLKPGGYHLMLFGLKSQPAENDSVFLTLYFEDQSTRIAKAFVRKTAQQEPKTQPAATE